MMVSRRNLVTIILMMMTVFFMFQFTQVIKVRNNQYDTNVYAKESILVADGRFVAGKSSETVVYFGYRNTESYDTVKEWCDYSKRYLITYSDLKQADSETLKNARMIIIDCKEMGLEQKGNQVERILKVGTPVTFFDLPSAQKVVNSYRMKKAFGIKRVVAEETEALGFQVFEGFLLGGEAAYMPQKEEEEKYNDFDCTVPWFELGKGTKTYAVAMMDEKEVKANDFPNLVWSNNYNNTPVFVVAFDLINSNTGVGFLSAIDYSSHEYSLYPVVNAQNMVLSDYPTITEENTDTINKIYSMDSLSLARDITWPVFISISKRYNIKLTCFTNTGYETMESEEAKEYQTFYLQQINEINGEMGRSLNFSDDMNLKDKLVVDEIFYEGEMGYHYSAAYVPMIRDDIRELISYDNTVLNRVHTVVGNVNNGEETLCYIDKTTTFQGITNIADEYTYTKELKNRCMLTSIGYSNTLIDMHKVSFPEGKDDEWQNFSKEISSNIHTFWARNRQFEYTAISESDTRVREFLNLKYSNEISDDDIITLKTYNVDEAYYVLRTHGKKIKTVEGGDFSQIEKDAYLIHATSNEVKIGLETSDYILHYDGLLK